MHNIIVYGELMHYGVPGMQWHKRRYVDYNGQMTAEGLARYRQLHPERRQAAAKGLVVKKRTDGQLNQNGRNTSISEEQRAAERKARTRKILAIAGGVAIAAIAGYAIHKKLGNVRDLQRKEILNVVDKMNMPTTASGWTASDKMAYREMLGKHAQQRANETTRWSVVKNKLGIQTRNDVLRNRRRGNEIANFYNKANNKATLNRQISDARDHLRKLETSSNRADLSENMRNLYKRNVNEQMSRIDDLIKQRRLLGA